MITATQLRPGMIIKYEDNIYIVLNVLHITPGNWRGMVQTKLRNIIDGRGFEVRFRSDEKLEVVILEEKEMEYLYMESELYYFMDTETYEQLTLDAELIGDAKNFLVPNIKCKIKFHDGKPVGIELPMTVDLKVVDTPPQIKGATATNSPKPATLETGLVIQVPPFIDPGDIVRIDTRTSEYLERVSKSE